MQIYASHKANVLQVYSDYECSQQTRADLLHGADAACRSSVTDTRSRLAERRVSVRVHESVETKA